MTLLVAAPDLDEALRLATRCRADGLKLAGHCACDNLVREAVRLAPQVVVLSCPVLDAPLLATLQCLTEAMALPVLVLLSAELPAAAAAPARLAGWPAAGVWACLPADCPAPVLAANLALVTARHAQVQSQSAALALAEARLTERKWIDRAKGLLMRHQALSEEDAFALLRNASMHANLRVGEVSRGLIEAAQAADAVNRAGQLRMLSQRVVKAMALQVAGAGGAAPAQWLADSLQRLQTNLAGLQALPLPGAAAASLQLAARAWDDLQQLARADQPDVAGLALADQQAEHLMQAADALTAALETAGGRLRLQVVNLSGRQRMLSQRLAKQAVLAGLLAGADADAQAGAAALTLAAFEAALLQLEQAPLASDDIRHRLAQARSQWQRMLQGVHRASGHTTGSACLAVALESEALLQSFEQLTSVYEHSMQVLLG